MENCDSCSDGKTCDICSSGFDYINGQCIKQIENCEKYTKDGNCEKCKENFAFSRNECLNKSSLDNYYTKDNGISYYPCDKEVKNCSKCYYDETQSKVKCYLCITNFFLFENEDKESCISESNLNSTIYKINSAHINKCSNAINNCNECTNYNNCTKCSNDFYRINDNKTNCIQTSNIPKDQYYLNQDETMYYACNNSAYNDILNCKSCSDKASCSLCQDEYTFIDGDKSTCVEIISLNNKYIFDPDDKTNYIKCISLYDNCDTRNNLKCLACNADYTIFNDNCISKSSLPTNIQTQTDTLINKPTEAPTYEQTNSPINPSSKVPTYTSINVPTNTPQILPTNEPTNSHIDKISKDLAEQKTNISLSFEKINNFNYAQDKKTINFDLSILTQTGQIKKGD